MILLIVLKRIKLKIFFRRSVKNAKKFACAFGKMCSVTPQNRGKCQFCRYQKCLAVGMKAECVLNDDELAEKRKMISRNRIRRILNQPAQMKGKFSAIKRFLRNISNLRKLFRAPNYMSNFFLSQKETVSSIIRYKVGCSKIRQPREHFVQPCSA